MKTAQQEARLTEAWELIHQLQNTIAQQMQWLAQQKQELADAREELLTMKVPEFDRCDVCNHELSQCGPQGLDGEPTLDCLVCSLGERLKEAREELAAMRDELEEMRRSAKGMV